MAKVTFRFEEGEPVVTYATEGERLLEVAQKSNVPIDAPCSGNASCGKCRVRLVSGELDSKITRHISEEEYQNGWRLACVSTVKGDVEVEVPDIASAYRSRMKVASGGRHFSARAIWSTVVGETADSLIFFPVAFGGIIRSKMRRTLYHMRTYPYARIRF